MSSNPAERQKALLGNINGEYWIYDSETGFDLTRPNPPTASLTPDAITLRTTTSDITIDPAISALVIIDAQNFFLSADLGRPAGSKGLKAQAQILNHAIPAARKAGIQIIWLNWGLSEQDLETLPPAEQRAFGFNTMSAEAFEKTYAEANDKSLASLAQMLNQSDIAKDSRFYKGLGRDLGEVTLPSGAKTSAGHMLMRDQWNTELSPPLQESYVSSLKSSKPDVWLHKNRISGMHVPDTPTGLFLREKGFKTLLFAGVNTDQCVNSTLTDAFCQGFDCVMITDGCATTSPKGAQESIEHNVGTLMGFAVNCEGFANDVNEAISTRH